MSSPELIKMDHDILRIIRDSECPATSKTITESFYRCETPTGASTIHARCVSLEKRGLLDSNKELLGGTARTTIVWKITDDGRMALQERAEPEKKTAAKNCHDIDFFFMSDIQKEPVEAIAEEKDDRKNITMTESAVGASSAPAEDKILTRELHPETVEYFAESIEMLHQIEDCIKTGRFSKAKVLVDDLLYILDSKSILEKIDISDTRTPGLLIVASDLLRGCV